MLVLTTPLAFPDFEVNFDSVELWTTATGTGDIWTDDSSSEPTGTVNLISEFSVISGNNFDVTVVRWCRTLRHVELSCCPRRPGRDNETLIFPLHYKPNVDVEPTLVFVSVTTSILQTPFR